MLHGLPCDKRMTGFVGMDPILADQRGVIQILQHPGPDVSQAAIAGLGDVPHGKRISFLPAGDAFKIFSASRSFDIHR